MKNVYIVVVASSHNLESNDWLCVCEKCDHREVAFEPCSETEAKELCGFVNQSCKLGNGRFYTNYERVWSEDRKDLHHVLGFWPHRFVEVCFRKPGNKIGEFRPGRFTRPAPTSVSEALQRLHDLERGS